jgi:glycosyltransferase involved in cell wall biosynthesis
VPYIEALSCGTVVVSTHNSGADELLTFLKSATLSDLATLGEAVVARLSSGPPSAAASEVRAVRDRFSWPAVTAAYVELYQIALGRRHGAR